MPYTSDENVLTVVAIDESVRAPDIGGDPHVPLMVRWGSTSAVIWHFTTAGGQICCELMIADIGGGIMNLTILDAPRVVETRPDGRDVTWEEPGVPKVSLEPFDLNPDLTPQLKLIKSKCIPKGYRYDGYVEISFERTPPIKWVTSGAIGFGVDDHDQIVAVRAAELALPAESGLVKGVR